MQGRVINAALAGIAELVRQNGHSPHQVAAAVGAREEVFKANRGVLSTREFNGLLEEAARVCEDRFFSLRLAGLLVRDAPETLLLQKGHAMSARAVISYLVKNLDLFTEGRLLLLPVTNEAGLTLCFEARRLTLEGEPVHDSLVQVTELTMALLCLGLRKTIRAQWRPVYAQFRHARPDDLSALAALFGERLYFNQDVYALFLAEPDLKKRDTDDAAQSELLSQDLPDDFDKPPSIALPVLVQRLILAKLQTGRCSLGETATHLGIKERTLQYRLRRDHTSYQSLYDSARHELAKQYLRHSDLSAASIAERLAFYDLPAFSKFFRKREGKSLKQYRDR